MNVFGDFTRSEPPSVMIQTYFLNVVAMTATDNAHTNANGNTTRFGCTLTGIAKYTIHGKYSDGNTRRFAQ